jgi:hypothetical protein
VGYAHYGEIEEIGEIRERGQIIRERGQIYFQ